MALQENMSVATVQAIGASHENDWNSNSSDDTGDTDSEAEDIEEDVSFEISSEEEAELEKQRIHIHDLLFGAFARSDSSGSTRDRSASFTSQNTEECPKQVYAECIDYNALADSDCKANENDCTTTTELTSVEPAHDAAEVEVKGLEATNLLNLHTRKALGKILVCMSKEKIVISCGLCSFYYKDIPEFSAHMHLTHEILQSEAYANAGVKSQRKSLRKLKEPTMADSPLDEQTVCSLDPLQNCGLVIFVLNTKQFLLKCKICNCKYVNMQLLHNHFNSNHHIFQKTTKRSQLKTKRRLSSLTPSDDSMSCKSETATNSTANRKRSRKCSESHTFEDEACAAASVQPKRRCTNQKLVVGHAVKAKATSKLQSSQLDVTDSNSNEQPCPLMSNELKTTLEHSSDAAKKLHKTKPASATKTSKKYANKTMSKDQMLYKCEFCTKTFAKPSRLAEHTRLHTGEKPFRCDTCDKSFRIKMRLDEHKMRHQEVKAFKCNTCGMAMATRQDFTLHQRHHKGDRRYQCTSCSKAFVRSSDLKIHTRIHTGEKPYVCEICAKSFRANQNLIVHRRSHFGEKKYKCDYCDKLFMRNIDRKVHHRTHTGERPFKCQICNRGYSSRVHVRSHFEREHLKQTANTRAKPGPKAKPTQLKCSAKEQKLKISLNKAEEQENLDSLQSDYNGVAEKSNDVSNQLENEAVSADKSGDTVIKKIVLKSPLKDRTPRTNSGRKLVN